MLVTTVYRDQQAEIVRNRRDVSSPIVLLWAQNRQLSEGRDDEQPTGPAAHDPRGVGVRQGSLAGRLRDPGDAPTNPRTRRDPGSTCGIQAAVADWTINRRKPWTPPGAEYSELTLVPAYAVVLTPIVPAPGHVTLRYSVNHRDPASASVLGIEYPRADYRQNIVPANEVRKGRNAPRPARN